MIRADMHIHTYYSDGGQSPADVVAGAKRAGVNLISVTDHDNSNGREEVKSLALKAGITAVDGEEISAYDGDVKVHILGYGINYENPAYTEFNKLICEGAEERTFDILRKLSKVNVNISYGEVLRERRCAKSPLHAVHIAIAGARKGYAGSPWAFYGKYLNYGTAGFSCIKRPTPEGTVKMITECGGVCSLAHPGRISLEKGGVISLVGRLVPCGLAGIEAVYSGHTATETQYYKELAERYGLLVTGGSDTHYAEGNRRIGDPPFYPDERLLSALKLL
ncbi:MAG: PHP domain-containing protein [Clostridiales bacterium]|nr:PHP domain-containing protein [Clostridiales bacterium]